MALSLHKRYEIVFLAEHPLGPKLSKYAIAKRLKCSHNTVAYWLKRYQIDKDLSNQLKSGRKPVTTEKQDQRLLEIVESEKEINSSQVQNIMKRK